MKFDEIKREWENPSTPERKRFVEMLKLNIKVFEPKEGTLKGYTIKKK